MEARGRDRENVHSRVERRPWDPVCVPVDLRAGAVKLCSYDSTDHGM